MILVKIVFFNSDDYLVNTEVIPCDSKETAKAIVEEYYKKALKELYDEDEEEERQAYVKNSVKRYKNGSIFMDGYEGGYAEFKILNKEVVSFDTISSIKIKAHMF